MGGMRGAGSGRDLWDAGRGLVGFGGGIWGIFGIGGMQRGICGIYGMQGVMGLVGSKGGFLVLVGRAVRWQRRIGRESGDRAGLAEGLRGGEWEWG